MSESARTRLLAYLAQREVGEERWRDELCLGWVVVALDCEFGYVSLTGPYSQPAAACEAAELMRRELVEEFKQQWEVQVCRLMPPEKPKGEKR
jgi:hypothetical protein